MIGSSPIIRTRQDLRNYVKRQLGWPVINIEIHDSQIEDAINEAHAEFIPYAYDGVNLKYLPLEITDATGVYTLPYNVQSVTGVYITDNVDFQATYSDMFSINYYLANDILRGGIGKIDLVTIELTQQFVETMGIVFGKKISWDYNAITKELTIIAQPYQWEGSKKVFLEYYRSIDYDPKSTDVHYIYDVKWIQQYASALARRQWAYNMMKYEGSVLPNGLTLNATGILQEAKEAITELKEQLHDEWEYPVDFFVG